MLEESGPRRERGSDEIEYVIQVLEAANRGDFGVRYGGPKDGRLARVGELLDDILEASEHVTSELVRVGKVVGQDGKMRERASAGAATGSWADALTSVNQLISDLVAPTNEVARVITAVARGDLTQKMALEIEGRPVRGEFLRIGTTVNSMVDQLNSFAAEVTRVAKEVGDEGKLGGQADVRGVSGTWKDLTDKVNGLAANLTAQVRSIAKVTTAVAEGDLSQKITVDAKGEIFELKNTINTMVDTLNSFAAEVTRVAKEVGTEGKLGGQAEVKGVSGTWKDLTDNVNGLAANLTTQVRNIAKVTTAVARGDLSQKITVDARGEILELKDVINKMVDQLNSFAAEVTRVAKEVGTEGKLGGQAEVKGVRGTWKDLTDNVNVMASNLTKQVRGIVKVVTAVANGDLSQKFVIEAEGEVAALAETINNMTGTLRTFADQVTTVAREVGFEGKLGGQAKVPGAAGTWRDLTDNVNQLAGNLTSQVRAIAEVSTAVAYGDLTRSITVGAQGEVAALKDNINQMIANLKDTTHKNQEQDWLKTNLAKFSGMIQGQRSIASVAQLIMSELTPLVGAQQGAFFMLERDTEMMAVLRLTASYGVGGSHRLATYYRLKESLIGQCAFEKKRILLSDVPDGFVRIASGLGEGPPRCVVVLPVLFEGEIKAVIELASFTTFSHNHLAFLDQLMDSIGVILNMISSSARTEELLRQLTKSNAELEAQAAELNEKAKLLELKNREVELASKSLEEKAEQLQLISKYKSEFLANMSHELRTPLNSLLILSKVLADNRDGNLSVDQVRFAETIHTSGNDLLQLINEILDLSKVEAGKMPIDPRTFAVSELSSYLEQTFGPVAGQKGLGFEIRMEKGVPPTLFTDPNRLQQILKNLLSNAFKFTAKGRVVMTGTPARDGMLRISVQDTGIGIAPEKQRLIFDAFQQADGTTSRKYGGTGLGLTISREIARLLGGTIDVVSAPDQGSTFTLCIPTQYAGAEAIARDDAVAYEAAPERPIPALPAHAAFDGITVLLVDDDTRNIFAIQTVLESRGMRVHHADNGQTALEILRERHVDVVLMDTMMPGLDGIAATRSIRQNKRFRTLPVISLTAKAMKGDRDKALEAGATDYVTKPVDPDKLLAIMHFWLAKAGVGRAEEAAAAV
jgi:signal transduction histidine kinase/HAMP domain-containing protein/ActR/RegA family two-component response regulator